MKELEKLGERRGIKPDRVFSSLVSASMKKLDAPLIVFVMLQGQTVFHFEKPMKTGTLLVYIFIYFV